MSKIDYSIATSEQIESALCEQIVNIRLARNITQAQLAEEAGISPITIFRLENGRGVMLNSFIRVLAALNLQGNLETLLPDTTVRPIERANIGGQERKRARPVTSVEDESIWKWGDESEDKS
jgi:transcriptional regulator with XRE-family HTH domain